MKINRFIPLVIGLFTLSTGFGQNQMKYQELVKEAWALYQAEAYERSAEKYHAAFDELDGKAVPNDRYNAACSYALSNDNENAFYHLFYLAENQKIQYRNLDHISTDADLVSLHSDKRWTALIAKVTANKKEYEKDLDKNLVAQLDEIYRLDQDYRKQLDAIEKKYGRDSEEIQAHWGLIHKTDSINLVKIKKILDERGWLGPKVVGDQGNMTLFLVIQHADLETQKKYLPMMREAVKSGNAQARSLALLEDRVALRQGKKQIYGSQIMRDPKTGEFFVSPLIEPEKVNERRAAVGLGTIESYISNWGLTWDVEKHKERSNAKPSEKKG